MRSEGKLLAMPRSRMSTGFRKLEGSSVTAQTGKLRHSTLLCGTWWNSSGPLYHLVSTEINSGITSLWPSTGVVLKHKPGSSQKRPIWGHYCHSKTSEPCCSVPGVRDPLLLASNQFVNITTYLLVSVNADHFLIS